MEIEKKLVLMVGVQGAGKSYYIDLGGRVQGHQILCLDDIRRSLGDIYNRRAEPIVRAIVDIMGRAYMERGVPIVVDGVNTSKYIVQKWKALGAEYGYKLIGIYVDTPYELCVERRLGVNKVTQEVLDKTKAYLDELLEIKDDYFDEFIVVRGDNGNFREST